MAKKPRIEAAADTAAQTAEAPDLPIVPDDESFLQILKTSGEQKVDDVAVMSGIKASLATRAGLYDLPAILTERMDKTSDELNEPIDADKFEEIYKLVAEKQYADVLGAIGLKGSGRFMTVARRRALLERIDTDLVQAIISFHNSLGGYRETLRSSLSEDMALMLVTGGMNAVSDDVRAMVMNLPSTDQIKSAAESFVNVANRTFAGWGVAVARVMAADALRLRQVLEHPDLPRFVGYLNKEQMLTSLNASVTAEDVQLERNLSQYALAILALNKGVDAVKEMKFVRALTTLDNAINWEKLGGANLPAKAPANRRF